MKTLVIISPGFPADEEDSTCLTAQQIFIRNMNWIYPDLKIIVLALQYPLTESEYQWHGNVVISFNSKKYGKLLRPLLWTKVYGRLRTICATHSVSGLLSFWCSETALIGNYFSKNNRIKHYCWVLGQDARKANYFVQWIRPRPEQLMALSDFLADEFYKNHKIKPAHIIPNGVDPNRFKHPTTKHRGIDILAVGSLIPLKQYRLFIDAITRLRDDYPGIKALICGRGPEEDRLRKLTETRDLREHIEFCGERPHGEVLEIMQRSKILLHPSLYEGYSTACLEALYAGCHVISFTKAEKVNVSHWHIVSSPEEMIETCLLLLRSDLDHAPILVHSVEDSARAVAGLFHQAENI